MLRTAVRRKFQLKPKMSEMRTVVYPWNQLLQRYYLVNDNESKIIALKGEDLNQMMNNDFHPEGLGDQTCA